MKSVAENIGLRSLQGFFHVTARGEFTVVYRFLFFYKQIVANKGEGNLLQVVI
ncbi:hypothetical protein PRUPE_2G046200 [Prunus persica]|uniref:Uncharacterized protein n=1 Tax=Prunus persica TaxID=3760 RepID=A0A251QB44_PRUPE|nr:hypothetical protein PRUPE_2G046200 [Prunus persica]